jgi:hypothetical protein
MALITNAKKRGGKGRGARIKEAGGKGKESRIQNPEFRS